MYCYWVKCTIGDIIIDHGTLSPGGYNGNISEKAGALTCVGGDATAHLSFTPSTIALSNGTDSILIFDESRNETLVISLIDNMPKSFTVVSTLSGTPAETGQFQGSSTIVLSID